MASTDDTRRCDYCRLPIVGRSVTASYYGDQYEYCTEACRESAESRPTVAAEFRDSRRLHFDIEGFDRRAAGGIPRNALVLLSAQPGARLGSILVELVWRTLRANEPVVFVTFHEPPMAVVEHFLNLDWNVQPALAAGQLGFVDCFTHRTEDPDALRDRLSDWNRHLFELVGPESHRVRDPSDVIELESKIDGALERRDMIDQGIVCLDSLNELGINLQPLRAYEFVKDIRASVSKDRFVPIFAGASSTGDQDVFPRDLEYLVDGIIDLEITTAIDPSRLTKRLRFRKLEDVVIDTSWLAYEFAPGIGLYEIDSGSSSGTKS